MAKRNNTVRVVVDYRRFNKQTTKAGYPFPSIFDQFSDLAGANVFSTIDLNSGYYQIKVSDESIPLTSFVIGKHQLESLRMPFGLGNVPVLSKNS